MSEIKTGWLIDFNDQIFAPKTVFSQVFQDSDGRNLNNYFDSVNASINAEKSAREQADNNIRNLTLYTKLDNTSTTRTISSGYIGVNGILSVANGGTGLTQFTANGILFGSSDGKSISFITNPASNINNKILGCIKGVPQYVGTQLSVMDSGDDSKISIQLNIVGDQNYPATMVELPSATDTRSGLITPEEQTFGGNKKFNNNLTVDGTTYLKNLDMNNGSITNIGGWASNSDEFYFIDNAENTIVFIDNEGVHTTNLSFGNKSNNKGIVMTYTSDDTLTITFEN